MDFFPLFQKFKFFYLFPFWRGVPTFASLLPPPTKVGGAQIQPSVPPLSPTRSGVKHKYKSEIVEKDITGRARLGFFYSTHASPQPSEGWYTREYLLPEKVCTGGDDCKVALKLHC